MDKYYAELDLNHIEPDPNQPRRRFTKKKMDELAESIREHGIIEPIEVTEIGNGRYRIHHGERRWRAAQLAGLETIPAVIAPPLEQVERLVRQTVENEHREELNVIEKAKAYQLLADQGLALIEIARRMSKTQTAITSCLIWLELEEEIQELVAVGQINRNPVIAKALLPLPVGLRLQIARKVASTPPRQTKVVLDLCSKTLKLLEKKTLAGVQVSSKQMPTLNGNGRPHSSTMPGLELSLKNRVPDPATRISLEKVRFMAQNTCGGCHMKPRDLQEPAWELVSVAAESVCKTCEIRLGGGSLAVCRECPMVKMLTQVVTQLRPANGVGEVHIANGVEA